jgi:peptide methionine sulfoxide reductase msrA/msrB
MINPLRLLYPCLLISLFYAPASHSAPDTATARDNLQIATFAGGCFWCTESDFEKLEGVVKVISGFTGGGKKNPTYQQVSSGTTGHLESVEVHFDPTKISYDRLLSAFWKMINPTDKGGQFVDRGYQYTTAIITHNPQQRAAALASRKTLEESGRYDKPIVTPILDAGPFYPAEDYHQDYYKHNPVRYRFYRWNSGRDQYLEKIWGNAALH